MELFAEIAGFTPALLCFVLAAAFFAGFVDSIAGGGGLISLPSLLLAGIPPHMALGTGKFMSTLGTTAACATYMRSGTINWRVVAAGLFFSLAGAAVGARLVLVVSPDVLGKVLVLLLPLAALCVLFPVRNGQGSLAVPRNKLLVHTPLLCFVIGLYDGFYGPSTGSFLLLGLHFMLRLPLVAASATAKPFNLASNLAAFVVFMLNGSVLYSLAVPLAAANILGNVVGSRLAIRKGAKVVRGMLFISLALLFGTLLHRYYA